LLIAAAVAMKRRLTDHAAVLYGATEEMHNSRVRYRSQQIQFQRITESHIDTPHSPQPLRWTLGVERGHAMAYEALIDLALKACNASS
jgi:hypothetical protein